MKLETIKRFHANLNRLVFIPAGCGLRVDIPFRRTRARDYWACWDTNASAFYFTDMRGLSTNDVFAIVLHEMCHQWQTEYLPDCLQDDDTPHDFYFHQWRVQAAALDLPFFEEF
jgi:hypothetical protein